MGQSICPTTTLQQISEDGHIRRLTVRRLSVPTFDSNDRVYDSWRCLYLFAGRKWRGAHGIYAAGGYQLAFAAAAHGLFKFPKELMELPLTPVSCNHEPEELFEYREESSGITWKCQADKNLSYIAIMGLESGEIQGGSLKIPDTVDGLPVEEIHCHAFEKEIYAEEIILPARLYKGGIRGSVFDNLRVLKNIRISPKNSGNFSCRDGVVYNKQGTRALWYPPDPAKETT